MLAYESKSSLEKNYAAETGKELQLQRPEEVKRWNKKAAGR
jgi:hypothetical protein